MAPRRSNFASGRPKSASNYPVRTEFCCPGSLGGVTALRRTHAASISRIFRLYRDIHARGEHCITSLGVPVRARNPTTRPPAIVRVGERRLQPRHHHSLDRKRNHASHGGKRTTTCRQGKMDHDCHGDLGTCIANGRTCHCARTTIRRGSRMNSPGLRHRLASHPLGRSRQLRHFRDLEVAVPASARGRTVGHRRWA